MLLVRCLSISFFSALNGVSAFQNEKYWRRRALACPVALQAEAEARTRAREGRTGTGELGCRSLKILCAKLWLLRGRRTALQLHERKRKTRRCSTHNWRHLAPPILLSLQGSTAQYYGRPRAWQNKLWQQLGLHSSSATPKTRCWSRGLEEQSAGNLFKIQPSPPCTRFRVGRFLFPCGVSV